MSGAVNTANKCSDELTGDDKVSEGESIEVKLEMSGKLCARLT